MNKKDHWEKVYGDKAPDAVSWYAPHLETSLNLIDQASANKSAAVIDIGGGDSKLVDYLLEKGYSDITVLDISEKSLERAKNRLGEKSKKVNWIVSDIKSFHPIRKYDLWHDRAAFHFLTTEEEVRSYLSIVRSSVKGYIIVGTFSTSGPNICSGLSVKQYDDKQLSKMFMDGFRKLKCLKVDHTTPFQTKQSFTFCSFKSIAA